MTGVEYALFGLLGGFLVEAVELRRAIQKTKGWPWRDPDEPSFGPWLTAILLRLAASAGLAFGFGAGGQISGALGALTAGIAAPLVIEKLATQLPGAMPQPDPAATPAASDAPPVPVESVEPQSAASAEPAAALPAEPASVVARAEAQP